jgi:protocatechuate 3,4-dioxygenase alpha subunit
MVPTSQQTIGPFFPAQFFGPADHDLTRVSPEATPTRRGETILLRGRVSRLGGEACVNAVLELWQPDAAGRFPGEAEADADFLGWGRACTDGEGRYGFRTVLPGGFMDTAGPRAPHANLTVLGSGLMRRVLTTVFFPAPGAPEAGDPVLALVPAGRRGLLLARAEGEEGGLRVFRFDIRLRGEGETPFFAV